MKNKISFIFLFLSILTTACKKGGESTQYLKINTNQITLKIGDTATVSIIGSKNANLKIEWEISNKQILKQNNRQSSSFTFTAENEGKSIIYAKVPELNKIDSCIITVGKNDLVRVLAIGNSFSTDALENYLFEITKSENKQIIIGNLFMGSASLADHVRNAKNNDANYSYRKIEIDGTKFTKENTTIYATIQDENWDYISFQQISDNSGILSTFEKSLPELYNYVLKNNPSNKTKYLLHQTWAYAPNSTHPGFKLYNNNQNTMYESIVSTYDKASKLIPTYKVIPVGTAIQNARTTSLGKDLTRDGNHLSLEKGRFIAACTWFEAIFNKTVEGNSYRVTKMTENETLICQWSAHTAIIQPLKTTKKTSAPY